MKSLACCLLILLLGVSCYAQETYNPGATVMVKDWLIFKVKDIVVPAIMEEFKQIKLADKGYNETHYELMVYDMETDIVPLKAEDIEVITDEAQNTLSVKVHNFKVQFHGNSMARFYFMHAHGEATIEAAIDTLSFTIEPKLKDDSGKNALDYDLKAVDMKAGEIKFTKLTLGIIPESILEFLSNAILEACTFIFNEFHGILDKVIVKVVDTWKVNIPDSVEIPNTHFNVSVSFPSVPKMYADRIEVPIDGTVFYQDTGYDPHKDDKSLIPSYNQSDNNNLQIHLHEYVINTALSAVEKSGAFLEVDKDLLKPLNLPVDIMTTTYIGHLFPGVICQYGKDQPMKVRVGIKDHSNTSLHFSPGKIHGDFIPQFTFFTETSEAFRFDIHFTIDADIHFTVEDKEAVINGKVNDLGLIDPTFTPEDVTKCDLPDMINKFEPIAAQAAINAINNVLSAGFKIPVVTLFKQMFEADLESVDIQLSDKFAEISFTIDIEGDGKRTIYPFA